MQPLTHEGHEQLRSIAQRYGVSVEAATNLLDALQRGSGSMAQFNHPELGGYGQWMRGGMIMIGDMFNNGLKATIDGMCNELNRLLESGPFVPVQMQTQSGSGYGAQSSYSSYSWWPSELGNPSSSGSQNDMRYAYFPGPRRLAIEQNGVTNVYDTLDHQIGGVSQQQGTGYSLSFSSQLGSVDLRQLPLISTNAPGGFPNNPEPQVPPPPHYDTIPPPSFSSQPGPSESEQDVFAKLERLGALKQKGVITEEEFARKKAELLARI